MNKFLVLTFTLSCFCIGLTESLAQHASLSKKSVLQTGYVWYEGEKIQLGPQTIYIDGNLDPNIVQSMDHVFRTFQQALPHLKNGNADEPMTVLIAPYVYWIDDPDDPEVRVPASEGRTPFGMEIHCEWLYFRGLTKDPREIILASNRGQTIGAKGNFTMFNLLGNGFRAENITFGNYCNVDLVYALKPSLSRKKRADAIVQAQLAFCRGDQILARNCRFVSRLNLCPLIGGGRTLFDRCHFECTDDALNGHAVYLQCDFDFYSSKPFWGTQGSGAVLLDCDVRILTEGKQFFVKSGGRLAIIDTRFRSSTAPYIGWKDQVETTNRNYVSNNTLNGKAYQIESNHPETSVDLTDKPGLYAYKFDHAGKTIYNTYNLLKGEDGWDPMQIKNLVGEHVNIPTMLEIKSPSNKLETGKDSLMLWTEAMDFSHKKINEANHITWTTLPVINKNLELSKQGSQGLVLIPKNTGEEATITTVVASNALGLEAAIDLEILPEITGPPAFSKAPFLSQKATGAWELEYELDSGSRDCSEISWYRCADASCANPIEAAVSRWEKPLRSYEPQAGDNGYYLMAEIRPKHNQSLAGPAKQFITKEPLAIRLNNKESRAWKPDFSVLSLKNQTQSLPGIPNLDAYVPLETSEQKWEANLDRDAWFYGAGRDGGAKDTGLIQAVQGARMLYTPIFEQARSMSASLTAIPFKTAGQGFGSARNQYLEIYIKLDAENMNGYALRIERTSKYSDAVDFSLRQLIGGESKPIGPAVSAICFRPNCLIELSFKDGELIARAVFDKADKLMDRPGLEKEVNLKAKVADNTYSGFGMQHTGTVGANATMIKDLLVSWPE